MRLWLVGIIGMVLALAGCGDCRRTGAPYLEVGTGETEFVGLDSETPEWPLVHGPQGGWHVLVGLSALGLDATEVVTGDLVGLISGEKVAENRGAWLTFRCSEETGFLESYNTFLIFDVDDHCPLHQEWLDVRAELTDTRGESVESLTGGMIIDPQFSECDEGT